MNTNKCLYEAPTTETLVVRFEGALLDGSNNFPGFGSGTVEAGDID